MLIVDGTLVPTRDHTVAAKSKSYRYSTNRNDSLAFVASGVDDATRTTTVIADGGYRGTRAVIPHRRRAKDQPLVDWKETNNASHRKVRARIEHTFAKMKVWKVLRDCWLRGKGSAEAMADIARLHNLTPEG